MDIDGFIDIVAQLKTSAQHLWLWKMQNIYLRHRPRLRSIRNDISYTKNVFADLFVSFRLRSFPFYFYVLLLISYFLQTEIQIKFNFRSSKSCSKVLTLKDDAQTRAPLPRRRCTYQLAMFTDVSRPTWFSHARRSTCGADASGDTSLFASRRSSHYELIDYC